MADTIGVKKSKFLSRLLRDEAGNAIAILAAAVIPVIGLVGGAVDVSRMYLVRSKLQAACDAGSLMGRRVQGAGQWSDDNFKANTEAERLFDANFGEGAYGAKDIQISYTEQAGNVKGTASAVIPMALMQIFNKGDQTITATCDAELRTPSTDVMFVIDTTGSMNCEINQAGCTNNDNVEAPNAKMKGLRTAVRCFYEILAKQNIAETTKEDCNETADPSGGLAADVRLRFGFVPYAANVNVGKLLPLDYIADSWSYQSRAAVFGAPSGGSGWKAVYGTESSPVQTDIDEDDESNTAWVDRPEGQNLSPASGGTWAWAFRAQRSSSCNVTLPPLIPGSSSGTLTFVSQTPNPVTYPDSLVTRRYEQTDGTWNYQYRYRYYSNSPYGRICRLQRREINRNVTTTEYQTTQPVTWEGAQQFLNWEYRKTTFDISGLKDTNNNAWNAGVTLPIGDNGTDKTVTWSGCIEERKPARINDNDPSDNWDPIPTEALDMDFVLAPDPSDPDTQWGPILNDVYYERLEWNGAEWVTRNATATSRTNEDSFYPTETTYVGKTTPFCPSEALLLNEVTPSGFSNYLDDLQAIGNTYHDIGLIWGARLMAQNGIFSNITNDREGIQRHVVFMTDGATTASDRDVAAYGISGLDRRQNDGSQAPGGNWLVKNVDARTQAACKWLRGEGNTTVWVVSYGDLGASTNDKLRACVDNNADRFFEATNTP